MEAIRPPVSVSDPTSHGTDPEGHRTGSATCGSDLAGPWAARAGGSDRHAEEHAVKAHHQAGNEKSHGDTPWGVL